MEDKRKISIATKIFLIINTLIWFALGTIISFDLHPGMPHQPIIKWTMTILSFVAGIILLLLFYLFNKGKIIAYRLTILYLCFSGILLFFDDFGWSDLLFLIFIIITIILLIIGKKQFIYKTNEN
jgi:hypothetical protein